MMLGYPHGTTTGCSCPATQPHKEPHTQHDVSHHHSTQTHAAQRKHRVTAASRDFSTGEGNKDASRRYLFEAETQSFKLKDAELLNIKPTELLRHLGAATSKLKLKEVNSSSLIQEPWDFLLDPSLDHFLKLSNPLDIPDRLRQIIPITSTSEFE